MSEIKLSEYIDENETKWKLECEEKLANVIDFLNKELNKNLYSEYKMEDAKELFNFLKTWLLVFHKEKLLNALNYSNVEVDMFYKEMIGALILTITREKKNVDRIIDALVKGNVIKSVLQDSDGEIFIDANQLGIISFRKASDTFDNDKTNEFLKKNNITSGCHESALFLIENYKNFTAITAICEKNIGERYYHSFGIDEAENVVDLTGNLVIPQKFFYQLYSVEEIHEVSYKEYMKTCADSVEYDESKTLMPLLRMAVYEQLKSNEKQQRL
ncbi:MAG TPA: hypothetical protein DEP72_07710 [Clostridiales bacterium]|nr:MAG: hypothetical protein A2Y18_06770 [Clostridiales bacterium GWD2_32_19]HCC08022.1 hypothetical protein [Clostridiales bacterium]